MKDLDIKSLIIGFLAASVVALVVVLIQPKEETKASEGRRYESMGEGITLDIITGKMYLVGGVSYEIKEDRYILIPIKGEVDFREDEDSDIFSKPRESPLETRPPKTDSPPKK